MIYTYMCSLVPSPPRPASVVCGTKSGGKARTDSHVMCAATVIKRHLFKGTTD